MLCTRPEDGIHDRRNAIDRHQRQLLAGRILDPSNLQQCGVRGLLELDDLALEEKCERGLIRIRQIILGGLLHAGRERIEARGGDIEDDGVGGE